MNTLPSLDVLVVDDESALREQLRRLFAREGHNDLPLTSSGAMISTELVVRCLAQDASLQELGVRHRPRRADHQSGTSPRVVARAFHELLSARRQLGTLRHARGAH
jgi:FixJ family two-component response regulator